MEEGKPEERGDCGVQRKGYIEKVQGSFVRSVELQTCASSGKYDEQGLGRVGMDLKDGSIIVRRNLLVCIYADYRPAFTPHATSSQASVLCTAPT